MSKLLKKLAYVSLSAFVAGISLFAGITLAYTWTHTPITKNDGDVLSETDWNEMVESVSELQTQVDSVQDIASKSGLDASFKEIIFKNALTSGLITKDPTALQTLVEQSNCSAVTKTLHTYNHTCQVCGTCTIPSCPTGYVSYNSSQSGYNANSDCYNYCITVTCP